MTRSPARTTARETIGAVLEDLVDYTHNHFIVEGSAVSNNTTTRNQRTRHSTTALRARPWIC